MSTIKEIFSQTEHNAVLRARIVKDINEAIAESLNDSPASGFVDGYGNICFSESIDTELLQEVREAANGAAASAYREHSEDPYTAVEEFDQNAVKDAFIELINDGGQIDHEGRQYGEFILEHTDLFPNLNTSDSDAMQHAASLCHQTFQQFQGELQEAWGEYNA